MNNERSILTEKTNLPKKMPHKPNKISDKSIIINTLTDVINTTKDYALKYDISKCIEIIEGKENIEFCELKQELENLISENEELSMEKNAQIMEIEELKNVYSKIIIENENLKFDMSQMINEIEVLRKKNVEYQNQVKECMNKLNCLGLENEIQKN